MAAAQGHLHADGGIIAVIEIAEAFKDIPLVVRPRQTVVDVLIGYGLGEKPVVQPAQAVRVQVPKRDAVLHGMGLAVALRLPDDGFNLFSLRPRELTLCGGLRVFRFCRSFQQSPYLLFQFCLPHQGGIGVVGLIDAPLRTDELALDQVPQDHFQRLSIFLIEGKQEEREHDKDHAQRRRGRTHAALAQKEKRHSHKRRRSETHKLPLRQAEQHLAFDFCQVLRDRYVCQN